MSERTRHPDFIDHVPTQEELVAANGPAPIPEHSPWQDPRLAETAPLVGAIALDPTMFKKGTFNPDGLRVQETEGVEENLLTAEQRARLLADHRINKAFEREQGIHQ